jgi:predicted permease
VNGDRSHGGRLLGALLRCYPAAWRNRFEDGMRDAFEREHQAARSQGSLHVLAFWTAAYADAAVFHAARLRPGGPSMKSFFTFDLRDALRSLRATPVVTAVAVASLALGIGANAALFTILNSLVLKPLPVRDPARLAVIDDGSWTNPIWEAVRERRHDLFEDAFAWSATRFNLATHGQADYVEGAWASGGMFDVLGVRAIAGRTFTEADDRRGGGPTGPVAVVSYGFAQRRLGGPDSAIGRSVSVDGISVTVIGVTPRGFFGPDVGRSADIIVPIGAVALRPNGDRMLDGRSTWWLEIMARLKPGQTVGQATARLDAMQPAIRAATLPTDWPAKMLADYLKEPFKLVAASNGESDLRRTYLAPLQVILVVVAAVLLIACANLASLLLARAAARRHELSVRLALGASRLRLARQMLAESVMLAVAGAALGLVVARWGSTLLVRELGSSATNVPLDLGLDWRVLGFTIAIAAVTTIVFGLAPAVGVSGVAPQDAMKEQNRTIAGDRRFGFRNALVAGQVALSLVLVVGAGLFVRTLSALVKAPLGFRAEGLLSASVDSDNETLDRDARLALFDRLRQSVAAVPGVANAAVSVLTPVSNMRWNTIVEQPPDGATLSEKQRIPWVNFVSPEWFDTYGIHLLNGRRFDDRDRAGSEPVVILSEGFARRLFPDGHAVGRRIKTGFEGPGTKFFQIVGVVNDTVYRGLREGFDPVVYAPFAQLQDVSASAVISVRAASGVPEALTRDLSDAIARTDPRVGFTITSVETRLLGTLRKERLVAMIAAFFGGLALLLAAIGLYGVTSHAVSRRRAEIGIRMALGADAGGVVRLVLARLGWLLASGVALGLAVSWWTTRLIEKLLFALSPRDALTFAAAAGTLVGIGLLAGWIPARRASRIDPVRVLRES